MVRNTRGNKMTGKQIREAVEKQFPTLKGLLPKICGIIMPKPPEEWKRQSDTLKYGSDNKGANNGNS